MCMLNQNLCVLVGTVEMQLLDYKTPLEQLELQHLEEIQHPTGQLQHRKDGDLNPLEIPYILSNGFKAQPL